MKKALVIPDIHLRVDKAKKFVNRFKDRVDKVIFLGDYFDNWKENNSDLQTNTTEDMCNYLLELKDDPKNVLLIGNHDIAYWTPLAPRILSRKDHDKWAKIIQSTIFTPEIKELRVFSLIVTFGRWTLSHAGLSADEFFKIGRYTALDNPEGSEAKKVFAVSQARGGRDEKPGILWRDWWEFEDVEGFPQIVGHSISNHVRRRGESYCLDTNSYHAMIINNENLEVTILNKGDI